jgi:hypothetical protein
MRIQLSGESRPNHEGEYLPAIAQIKFEKRVLPIRGVTDQLSPFSGRAVHKILHAIDDLTQGARAI